MNELDSLRAVAANAQAPDADIARVIDGLEKDFLRLRGMSFDEQLTVTIVEALRPSLGDIEMFLRAYDTFVDVNTDKLAHVFSEYRSDFRHLLLGQPECILIFYLMGRDRPALEDHWPSKVPIKLLNGLDDVWVP